jgi:hypothetical protein
MPSPAAYQDPGADSRALVMVPIEELAPYEKNARTHTDEQVTQIVESIKEFGFTAPILIDGDKGVLAGHGRLMAARFLEMKEVPCVMLSHLTAEQRRAYILADNKLALNAGWDLDLLAVEIEALKLADFDISLLGFSQHELDQLTAGDWGADFGDPTEKDGEHTEGIEAKIVIKCGSIDKEELVNVIKEAVELSGIDGVKVDG